MSTTVIDQLVANMSLEEQFGQLLMAVVDGPEFYNESAAMLGDCHLSGDYIRENNIGTVAQFRALTAHIQELVGRRMLSAIIATDQVGLPVSLHGLYPVGYQATVS